MAAGRSARRRFATVCRKAWNRSKGIATITPTAAGPLDFEEPAVSRRVAPPYAAGHSARPGAPNAGTGASFDGPVRGGVLPLRRRGPESMLDRPLDPGVERVQPVERERLGRAEAPLRRRFGAVVGQDAVRQREPAGVVEAGALRARLEHSQPDLDVPEQPPLVGQADLRAERELARA